jgi:hypothetical protein
MGRSRTMNGESRVTEKAGCNPDLLSNPDGGDLSAAPYPERPAHLEVHCRT